MEIEGKFLFAYMKKKQYLCSVFTENAENPMKSRHENNKNNESN